MRDAKCIAALKRHDIAALEDCIQRYTAYVSTILRNVLRETAAAADIEELTADVFVALWQHTEQLQTTHLQGYLAAIARSKAYNWLRKQKLQTTTLDSVILSSEENMEQTAEQLELAEILQETLSDLPCTEQDILIRYYYYQQTVREIAEEMKLNENTVKTKLFRSRKKLRRQLTERGYNNDETELV
ncbi:MAG: RNA polymerase sigma factor [Ruminococcus sp.]